MGFGGYRRQNLFPSYGEQEESPFDTSGINKKAFGVQPFGSSYYPRESIERDDDYESDYAPSSTLRRYLDLIGSAPTREQHAPTKIQRIMAALGGGATGFQHGAGKGIETALGIRDINYNQALGDYEGEVKRAGEGVQREQAESQIKSLAGYRAAGLTEKARDRIRKEAYDEARTATAREKEKGINLRFGEELTVKSADQKARDRHYQEMDRINDAYKKGLISESQKDRELEGELGRERNRVMGITAAAATTSAGARVTAAEAAKKRAETGAAGKVPKPITPAAQTSAHNLATKRVYEENPGWKKYFDKKGNLKAAGTLMGFGPVDQEEYNKVRAAVSAWEKRILAQMPAATPDEAEEEEIEQTDW